MPHRLIKMLRIIRYLFFPAQIFSHALGREQYEKRSKVKTKAVAELGEANGAMGNQDGKDTDDGKSGIFAEFAPRSLKDVDESRCCKE